MAKRKVCVVTGGRADYGLLYWPMKAILAARDLKLQLVVTGMHLVSEHGETWRNIENDGFSIDRKVHALAEDDGDGGVDIARAIGRGVAGIAEALAALCPDIVLLLGDRYEILAAAEAALVMRIPVAHIAGGDVTRGAYDDAIRHSISKMAQVHFVTHAEAGRRLRQLGEDPDRIHVVGSPGVDAIKRTTIIGREELERALGIRLRQHNALVTFHPVTWGQIPSSQQLSELLKSLHALGREWGLFFTRANSDNEHKQHAEMVDAFIQTRGGAPAFAALGTQHYLSLMTAVDAVIGNSSSGLYEAPSMGRPTVNVGDRQSGRPRATSVIDCVPQAAAITQAIEAALALNCASTVNPYGDGQASERIVAILKSLPSADRLLRKRFHDIAA